MNLGLVQNACRKAVVVGAKCADRYQSSILAALESAHPNLAICPQNSMLDALVIVFQMLRFNVVWC